MSKYTKGPWRLPRHSSTSVEADGRVVADCGGWWDTRRAAGSIETEQAANARLIAAAPDMAEKLLKIHNWLLHNAESSERGAEANKRFQWLAESQLADARNFRATAKDVAAALQKAGIEL